MIDVAKYAVTDEGVEELNKLSARLPELLEEIETIAAKLQSELDSNSSGIGPHAASIESLLEEIETTTRESADPVEEISEDVADLAKSYQDIIANDRFNQGKANNGVKRGK